MKRRSGLWVEIGLNLALLTVAVLLLDVGVFLLASRSALTSASVDLAETSARTIASQLSAVGPEGYAAVVEAHGRSGVQELALLGPTGAVLAGQHPEGAVEARAVFATRALETRETEGGVEVVAPVGGPGAPVAALWLRLPRGTVGRPAWAVIAVHALFSGGLIVAFGVAGFRRSVVGPLERLRDATRRIAAGERGVVAEEEAALEIAELAAALNAMARDLERYREEMAAQVTSLEQANQALREAREELVRSEQLASVGRLAAGVAHELGNPLSAVRGYLELLTDGLGEGEMREEVTRRASAEVERMHVLLRALLDFSRQGFSRQSTRTVADVPLPELFQEALRTVRLQAAFRDLSIEVAVEGPLVARVEASRIHQVLVNLLLNAAAAGARKVTLSGEAKGDRMVVCCCDDGCGIAPEHLPRVFEPFFTTRPPGAGTGLGLAVSWQIVEQHGGEFRVESTVGEGTMFSFTLPASGMTAADGALTKQDGVRARA